MVVKMTLRYSLRGDGGGEVIRYLFLSISIPHRRVLFNHDETKHVDLPAFMCEDWCASTPGSESGVRGN